MKFNLKSLITLIIVIVLSFSFTFVVIRSLDEDMAKSIVMAFLTIATSTVGFFIGYQTNKTSQAKSDEEDEK
jgi:hypothetical protein